MAITITRDLNVVPIGVPPVIHLSQYDSDFTLVFNLYASTGALTIPSGTTAEIRGTKRDGNGYDADATVSGTTVTVTGDVQMTAIAGANIYELALYKNSKQLFTSNFILAVEPSALDGNTITSESVLKELNAIIAGATVASQAAQDAEDAADRAEEAAASVEYGLITPEIKTALLACFEKVAWIDEHGQDYYDALETALNQTSLLTLVNKTSASRFTIYGTQDSYGCNLTEVGSQTARCVFNRPLKNNSYVIRVTDPTKYNLAVYDLVSNQLQEVPVSDSESRELYIMSTSVAPAWKTMAEINGYYAIVSFKKLDGTDFTDEELANFGEAIFTYETRENLLGKFYIGHGIGKGIHMTPSDSPYYTSQVCAINASALSARAYTELPAQNNGYTFTVTDSSKYNIVAYDVQNLTEIEVNPGSNIGYGYLGGNKSISWKTSDSVTTDYVWICLKKLDNTDFTAAELANGAKAVFTIAPSS